MICQWSRRILLRHLHITLRYSEIGGRNLEVERRCFTALSTDQKGVTYRDVWDLGMKSAVVVVKTVEFRPKTAVLARTWAPLGATPLSVRPWTAGSPRHRPRRLWWPAKWSRAAPGHGFSLRFSAVFKVKTPRKSSKIVRKPWFRHGFAWLFLEKLAFFE